MDMRFWLFVIGNVDFMDTQGMRRFSSFVSLLNDIFIWAME